jgi:hypothetical protein
MENKLWRKYEFLTAEEVVEILRIPLETLLDDWKDYIGYYEFAHRIMFDQSDVEDFIRDHFRPGM